MSYSPSFGRLVRAELKKITSLTGSWVTAGIAILLTAGLTVVGALSIKDYIGNWDITGTGSLSSQFGTSMFAMFIMFTIATSCLVVTNEYSSNTIQMSLLSTNSRLKFYFAKYLAFMIWWGLITFITLVSAIIIIHLSYSSTSTGGFDFGNTDTLMGFVSFFLVSMIVATMGVGTAMLVRSTAGSITAMFGLLFVLQLVQAIPVEIFRKIGDYLPFALMSFASVPRDIGTMADVPPVSPNLSLLLFAVWGLGLFALGGLRLAKTDA